MLHASNDYEAARKKHNGISADGSVPWCLPDYVQNCVCQAGLGTIMDKLACGERLDRADGIRLYAEADINALGALANAVRERINGNLAWFNRNLHINYTNICSMNCRFCAFHRNPDQADAYLMLERDIEYVLRAWEGETITEVHIVGGVNPELPFSYYTKLLATVKRVRPGVHIKAFTMVELAHMIEISGLSPENTILALCDAGLEFCPGGGCEILSDRIHQELFPAKISPDRWLEIQRLVQRCGVRTNATMLYGHIETAEERVDHMLRLRALQDETHGFQAFIPLAFHPENTGLAHLATTTGMDDLKNIAISRLMLDNFPHIKAFWVMLSPQVAQVSLSFGADDLDGTVLQEKITHDAGAKTPRGLSLDQLLTLIQEAGRTPAERDTDYQILRLWESPS